MKIAKGFTLLEIMIVVAIISILGVTIFPTVTQYLASARDSNRVVDVRSLAGVFQVYRNVNEALPDNSSGAVTSYCISEILFWPNGIGAERQYKELLSNFNVVPIEKNIFIPINPCVNTGSYLYSRLTDATAIQYGILAARMETVNSITYLTGTDFTSSVFLSKILKVEQIKGLDMVNLSGLLTPIYHIVVY